MWRAYGKDPSNYSVVSLAWKESKSKSVKIKRIDGAIYEASLESAGYRHKYSDQVFQIEVDISEWQRTLRNRIVLRLDSQKKALYYHDLELLRDVMRCSTIMEDNLLILTKPGTEYVFSVIDLKMAQYKYYFPSVKEICRAKHVSIRRQRKSKRLWWITDNAIYREGVPVVALKTEPGDYIIDFDVAARHIWVNRYLNNMICDEQANCATMNSPSITGSLETASSTTCITGTR